MRNHWCVTHMTSDILLTAHCIASKGKRQKYKFHCGFFEIKKWGASWLDATHKLNRSMHHQLACALTLHLTENICIRISGQLVKLRKMNSNNVWLVTVMNIGSTSHRNITRRLVLVTRWGSVRFSMFSSAFCESWRVGLKINACPKYKHEWWRQAVVGDSYGLSPLEKIANLPRKWLKKKMPFKKICVAFLVTSFFFHSGMLTSTNNFSCVHIAWQA